MGRDSKNAVQTSQVTNCRSKPCCSRCKMRGGLCDLLCMRSFACALFALFFALSFSLFVFMLSYFLHTLIKGCTKLKAASSAGIF